MFFIATVSLLLALPVSSNFIPSQFRSTSSIATVTLCFVQLAGLVVLVLRRQRDCRSSSVCGSSQDATASLARPAACAAAAAGAECRPRAAGARPTPGPSAAPLLGRAGCAASRAAPQGRQDSQQPVQPPSLAAKGFPEQVDELLALISPTAKCERVVQELAQTVRTLIRKHWPSACVHGVTCGELTQCTSFGVAVPEVDIVVQLRPHELAWPLQARPSRSSTTSPQTDLRKLHKSAIRICTDLLVSEGGFKFRRSAFRGKEPKVTLMAPRSLGLANQNIPIDLSVNAATPLCNSGLLTEIGRLEPRARALALLVRRWAKDRGICHAAKGHLPPYAWTLLTIYFLQGGLEEGPLLPPLRKLVAPASPDASIWAAGEAPEVPRAAVEAAECVGALFREFIRFYSESVDWKAEAVSARRGRREPPREGGPPQAAARLDGGAAAAATIEDPFAPSQNVGQCLSAEGFSRLLEELQRAQALIESSASLTELLCPWVPPDQQATRCSFDQDEDDEDVGDVEEEGQKALSSASAGAAAAPSFGPGAPACLAPPPGLHLAGAAALAAPPGLERAASPSRARDGGAVIHPWSRQKHGAAKADAVHSDQALPA